MRGRFARGALRLDAGLCGFYFGRRRRDYRRRGRVVLPLFSFVYFGFWDVESARWKLE